MEDSGFKQTDTNEESKKESIRMKVNGYYNSLKKTIKNETEPKAYILFDGKSVNGLLQLLKELLIEKKHMEVQELYLENGSILLQSRTKKGYLKQFAGLAPGVNVHIINYKNGQIEIYLNESKWMDKDFTDTLTSLTVWPLSVVPGIGTYQQITLQNDIYKLLEDYFDIG